MKIYSFIFLFFGLFTSGYGQNLLTLSPSFEDGAGTGPNADGNGPGSSLNGAAWFLVNNSGNGTVVDQMIYRKTGNPAPQHLTGYLEAVTPNDPAMNAHWKLQAFNNQNLTATLTNATEYRISFYYQNTAGHNFAVSIENVDGSANVLYQSVSTEASSWTLFTATFTMNTATVTDARLKLNFGLDAGTTLVDNVILEPTAPSTVNLLTTNPSFEESATSGPNSDGNGPGSSLNGGAWYLANNSGNGTAADQMIYRKSNNPAPQHLTGYLEAVTPNEAAFDAGWKLQAISQLNMTNALTNGTSYTVSFYYRNSENHTFSVSMEKNNGSATLFNQPINTAASEWTLFTHTFTMNTTILDEDGRLKFNFGSNAGTTQIDNVILTTSSTLPVTLVNFDAIAKGNEAHLIWSTSSEVNNKKFIISKSNDGYAFNDIAYVEPSISGRYNYVDLKLQSGHYFYKLSQVDLDGTTKMLGIKKVTIGQVLSSNMTLYPNPSPNRIIFMRVNGLQDGIYKVRLLSPLGIEEAEQVVQLQNGEGRLNLPLTLNKGIHLISLITGNGIITQRIVTK